MSIRPLACLLLLFGTACFGATAPSSNVDARAPAKQERAPIREFDLETLGQLGRRLALHDYLAWVATDVVVAHVGGMEKLAADHGVGWVVDTSGTAPLVHFLRQPGDDTTLAIAHTVRFPANEKPFVVPPGEFSLVPSLRARHKARDTALREFAKRRLPICNDAGPYNFVVLNDPDGSGFLVYLLRPKRTMQTIPVGGHYRITVSADGESVEQIDALSASCLAVDRPEGKDGDKLAAITVSHLVSPTPVETHVFLALQEKLPLYVVTPQGGIWLVENGQVIAQNREPDQEPVAPEKSLSAPKTTRQRRD